MRLSDLWAPAWTITVKGRVFEMRPLSLGTFAAMEAAGLTLSKLSSSQDLGLWVKLFCFLAGLHGEEAETDVQTRILQDPLAFRLFQERLNDAVATKQTVQKETRRRQVKNPLEELKSEARDDEASQEELDVSFILMVSRLSGISLADLSRMSWRGIGALNEWLKENPPTPPMSLF